MKMDQLISAFPANLSDALAIARNTTLKNKFTGIQNILICGMGGSGIGGKLVANWLNSELSIPVLSIMDYDLPNWANENTLFIASSYSGHTEETLEGLEQAIKRNCKIVGVTSGGRVEEICQENGYDCVVVPGGNPPRTQLGFSIVQITNLLEQYGLVKAGYLAQIETGRTLIVNELAVIQAEAKVLASFLQNKIAVLYSDPNYEAVAVRARQQYNENAKVLCWHHVIPEMNHNELVGWSGGSDQFAVLIFDGLDMNPRNHRRMEINIGVMEKYTQHIKTVVPKGNTLIEKSIYFIHLIDWSSFYLSEIYAVDPIEIKVIEYLKGEMGKF
jgi:glucose/mannose-6-phosphate isomerase